MWNGVVGTIPAGWVLCDGTNGTPDLRDRFVPGAGGALAPGDTGGAVNHDHSFTATPHLHTIPPGTGINTGFSFQTTTTAVADTGIVDDASSLPPFHALLFIMKT